MRPPGSWLRSIAERVCSPATMERMIDPVIADLQWEHGTAVGAGPWRRRWILARGYVAFWLVIAISLPRWTAGATRDWIERDEWALGRVLGCTAVVVIVLSAIFVLPSYRAFGLRSIGPVWRLLLILPQAVPASIPIGLLAGTLWGLRHRTTVRNRRAILVIGLLSSLTMVGILGWLVPAANQAFRVAVAERYVSPGVAETKVVTLRQQALELRAQGRPGRAASLILDYHVRWSIAGAALAFAFFGFSVSSVRPGRLTTVILGVMVPPVYWLYFFLLDAARVPTLANEGAVIALAWLPNLVLALISGLFLRFGSESAVAITPRQ